MSEGNQGEKDGGSLVKPGEVTVTESGRVLQKKPPATAQVQGENIEINYRVKGEDPRGAELPAHVPLPRSKRSPN